MNSSQARTAGSRVEEKRRRREVGFMILDVVLVVRLVVCDVGSWISGVRCCKVGTKVWLYGIRIGEGQDLSSARIFKSVIPAAKARR